VLVSTESRVREVAPGIYEVFLPLPMRPTIVNVWLVDGGGGEWALIDTGMRTDDSLHAFREALAILRLEPTAIRRVIGTHHHPDHFGTSGPLRDLCHAEVHLHGLEIDRMRTFLPQPRSPEAIGFFRRNGIPLERFAHVPSPAEFWAGLYAPIRPDHLIDDGDEIRVGTRTLRVVWTPGHSPGHCCLLFPAEKILIVGDHLLPKITPHIGVFPDGPTNPLRDYLASLEKVARLDVELVLPAHGGVYHDHRHRVDQLVHHHEYRMLAALDAARTRPLTAYEIAQQIFDFDLDAPPQIQFPATFESLAHLALLVDQGRLAAAEDDGCVRFRAK
jgi:glyoxylase-like metal-dependent hydrolase (beta-lactamase superfamily II)